MRCGFYSCHVALLCSPLPHDLFANSACLPTCSKVKEGHFSNLDDFAFHLEWCVQPQKLGESSLGTISSPKLVYNLLERSWGKTVWEAGFRLSSSRFLPPEEARSSIARHERGIRLASKGHSIPRTWCSICFLVSCLFWDHFFPNNKPILYVRLIFLVLSCLSSVRFFFNNAGG